jgi:glycosyltransferase involved in cell wall biosynthesis
MHIAVIFNRFGPYHLARLNAAGLLGKLTGIEVVARDRTYAWDLALGADRFNRITLFKEHEGASPPTADLMRRLSGLLDGIRPDVLAVPGWSQKASLLALKWGLQQGVPAVVMSDSNWFDRPRSAWKERVKRRIVKLFPAGLVGGSRSMEYLAGLGVPRNHVFTPYDVVDNKHFSCGAATARQHPEVVRRQYGLPERYFLSISRLVPQKNIVGLLEAYALYRSASCSGRVWSLVLVGDGPQRGQIETRIRELGLESQVTMVGFRQYPELPAFYGLADAFVLPSSCEPWGLVVNEAMAAGLPVLVSERCGCAPDLVDDGRNGFLFDPSDPRQLASHMAKIAADGCDREAMGQRSREIINEWSTDNFARNLWRSCSAALLRPSRPASLVDRAVLKALI